MRPIRKIAMIGATGMLGLPVAIALMEAGFEVTALARNSEQARRALPQGICVVQADVRDEESLRAGLAGQDALYLNLSVAASERRRDFHTEAQGLQNITAAARAAGIARLAYVSALIHDAPDHGWWVPGVWRQALAQIKGSGIAYTIFYPTNFMETLAQRHIAGRYFVMPGRARHANYWIAGSDFGRQVAKSFALSGRENREYVIQGPEAATYDEAAQRYLCAMDDPPRFVRLPLWMMRLGGTLSRELEFNARIMQAVLSYPEVFKATSTWEELGRPTTTIEAFAARRRADA